MQDTCTPSGRRPQRAKGHAACVSCHQRKIKCDAGQRGLPCSNCISSRRSDCQIHIKKRRNLSYPRPRSQVQQVSVPTVAVSSPSVILLPRRDEEESRITQPETASPILSTPDSDHRDSQSTPDDHSCRRNLVGLLDQADIGRRPIHNGVRITYVGEDVSNLNFLIRQRPEANETVHHFPSDLLAKRFVTHESERIAREAFILPPRAIADELVDAYFEYINPGCPIIDEEQFMRQYRGRDPNDAPSLLVLQSILLVGAHVSRQSPERDEMKATFFRRAKAIFDARLERNRDVVMQAALLLTWHSDGEDDIWANAWFWVGVAARIALGLGMHRDVQASTLIPQDKRIWRRTWWVLVQFDVMVSLSYGRPNAINLEESDVQALTPSDFQGCGDRAQVDYVIRYTEFCVLVSRVIRERFGLNVTPSRRREALERADEALANWCMALPVSLQLSSSEFNFFSASLHLTYNNILILLHRPRPKTPREKQDHGINDSDICNAAAVTIMSIFEDLRKHDGIKRLWHSDVNALFTAMVQISVELRFRNPVLAINALRRFDSGLASLESLANYWINADSILRLFKESSHIQHDLRLKGPKSTVEATERRTEIPEQIEVYKNTRPLPGEYGHSDLDILAAAATAGNTSTLSDVNFVDMSMDDEWREIYWQEPGICDFLGDGFWGITS